ncbi:hypothetical protein J3F84DRAFT_82452 [Trichoderma pleuroticola]
MRSPTVHVVINNVRRVALWDRFTESLPGISIMQTFIFSCEAASSRRATALVYGPAAIPVINRRKYALMPGAILPGILLGFCASSWALIGPTAKPTWILCIRHTALAGLRWSRESQLPQRLTMKLRQSGVPRRPNAAMSQSPTCLLEHYSETSSFRFVSRMFPSQQMNP